jgi:hypothetical protein
MLARSPVLFLGITLASLLSGCTLDHRKDVAYSLLFKPDGFENDKALSAAVSARFPPGSTVSELRRYAAINGGECSPKGADGLVCEITTRAQFCAARWLRIEATVEGSVIKSVTFVSSGAGC